MELGLGGKVAIVTGASRGLGQAIADELAREGCALAVCARGEDLHQAADAFRAHGVAVFERTVGVTDPSQVREFVAAAVHELGGIDILVNNAGRAQPGNFGSISDEQWQADIEVKQFSMIRCSREVIPTRALLKWWTRFRSRTSFASSAVLPIPGSPCTNR